jgi:hypothetical protein
MCTFLECTCALVHMHSRNTCVPAGHFLVPSTLHYLIYLKDDKEFPTSSHKNSAHRHVFLILVLLFDS